jgi:hypothetical protein
VVEREEVMPLNKYFKGHGPDVMKKMKKKYGSDKGESVFYATANKKGLAPSEHTVSKFKKHQRG